MNSIGAIKTIDSEEEHLQETVRYLTEAQFTLQLITVVNWFRIVCFSDILATAIRLCVYPIDFSIYAACPRAHENSRELSVSNEFMLIIKFQS